MLRLVLLKIHLSILLSFFFVSFCKVKIFPVLPVFIRCSVSSHDALLPKMLVDSCNILSNGTYCLSSENSFLFFFMLQKVSIKKKL